VKEHWTELQTKMPLFSEAGLVTGLSSFCDAPAREDIQSFFARHKVSAAERALEQTIERINNCIELKEKQAGVLGQWMRKLELGIQN
jgi:hypothetical protein